MNLPIEAQPTDQVTVPGYYWWLPQSAESTAEEEWTIVCFHPRNNKRLAGWFVGPLHPPTAIKP